MTPGGGWASAGPCPSLRCGAGDEASQMRATGSGHIDARIPAPKIILGNERTSGRAIHGHFPERCAGTGLAKCEAETGPGAYRGIQRCRRSMPRPPSVAWSPVDSALLIVPEPAARELAQDFLGRACEGRGAALGARRVVAMPTVPRRTRARGPRIQARLRRHADDACTCVSFWWRQACVRA